MQRRRTTALIGIATLALVAGGAIGTAPATAGPAGGAGPDGRGGTATVFPEVIPLPDAFQPEGITFGCGPRFYVGSLVDGDIWAGNAVTGRGELVVDVSDRVAVGLAFDRRRGALVVAGGPTGQAYVYDGRTGDTEDVAELGGGFVNDVAVTRDAYWFTDSFAPVLYRVPVDRRGGLGEPEAVPLGDSFEFVPGGFNANGIVALPGGRYLVLVNSTTGDLYRVDTRTGEVSLVDVESAGFVNGDGLTLRGDRLYVVQNADEVVTVVDLDRRADSGRVVATITDEDFRFPTTADLFGPFLYAVNARFDEFPPMPGTAPPAGSEFEVVRVPAVPTGR